MYIYSKNYINRKLWFGEEKDINNYLIAFNITNVSMNFNIIKNV